MLLVCRPFRTTGHDALLSATSLIKLQLYIEQSIRTVGRYQREVIRLLKLKRDRQHNGQMKKKKKKKDKQRSIKYYIKLKNE